MRLKATIAYDGTRYVGYQVQPNGNSIQAELEKALKRMTKGIALKVYSAGRTDSGVHARGQVIHFDYPVAIKPENALRALNSLLPTDIRVVALKAVRDDFNAQYHSQKKRYRYQMNTATIQDPFTRQYMWHHPYHTKIEPMREALEVIVGEHDFTSFCSTKTDKENKVRTVYRSDIEEISEDRFDFIFEGNGFLYNMIRILVGTSVQIGDGLRTVETMAEILKAKNRNDGGPTAPAHGLFLERVWYPEEVETVSLDTDRE